MNIYTYSFISQCPNDNDYIYYTVQIKTKQMIMIEDIKKYCERYKKEYHESIAGDLFSKFKGKQTITAIHKTVKIKTIRK